MSRKSRTRVETNIRKKKRENICMIRRFVNGFVHDLRLPQLRMFLSEGDRILSSFPYISPGEQRFIVFTFRVVMFVKTSLRLLFQRRGCPVWMQQMVDQLQCDSCLESSDAQNARQVSLATPPKLWEAVKVDIFELEDSQKKRFLCTLFGCSLQTVVMLMLSGRKSSSAFRAERCNSHFTFGQGLDAAFSTVFDPWWMFRQ